MKKINVVKQNKEFKRIIDLRQSCANKCFIVNFECNNDNIPKFGISISKKLGNAVVRNKNKRQIRNILDINKKVYQKNLNYIIIIRQGAVEADFNKKSEALLELLNKIKEKMDEKK